MARFKIANDLINQVAVETGLQQQANIFATSDTSFAQLIAIANSCGIELAQHLPWQQLVTKHTITTASTDTGRYPLPDDFAYMLNQTGWEVSSSTPMGVVSPQEWTYLVGSTSGIDPIRVSFRLNQGEFWLYPYAEGAVPPPDGLVLTFEYVSRNWVVDQGEPQLATVGTSDTINEPSDVILFEPYLFERLLKTRFLQARGFDSTAAAAQLESAFEAWSGKDKAAPILNATNRGLGMRYLNGCNAPESGYGQ